MTIDELLKQLTRSMASRLKCQQVTVEFDCDSAGQAVAPVGPFLSALSSLLQYAIECSPTGSRVSIATITTVNGTEIEIADSSDLTAETARERSFVIASASRDLRDSGCQLNILNCPQGGVAYSIALPRPARVAA